MPSVESVSPVLKIPDFARLERELAAHKCRAASRHAEPETEPPALSTGLSKLPRLTAAQEAEMEERLQAESAAHVRALAERQMQGRLAEIPPLYREAFDFAKVNPSVDRAEIEKVLSWEPGQGRGLWIVGETGHSKSRALGTILEKLIRKGMDVRFFSGVQWANYCTAAFRDDKTEEFMRALVKPDILVLDDLAKRWTPATQEGTFDIFERRTSRKKPILATINYTGAALKQKSADPNSLIEPLLRRVEDYCDLIIF